MSDVIHTLCRSDRTCLAVSFVLFAIAGGIDATADTLGMTIVGTTFAIGGVYLAARFARAVPRRRLAIAALTLWSGFLGLTGIYVVGVETVAGSLPESVPMTPVVVRSIAVATLLLSCAVTVFLGCREYGLTPGTRTDPADDRVADGDSDYSIR